MDYNELLNKAEQAKAFAYVPYSNFRVGAALLTKSGKVYTGCNIEIASYGGTNCAERTAIFKAVSEGEKDFKAIAIVSDNEEATYPCGICRQVIVEFGKDIEIVVRDHEGYKVLSIDDLLPHSFTRIDLKE